MARDLFNELPRSKLRGMEGPLCERFRFRHPRMFLSGVQIRIRLDSRLKHVGMTDVGSPIDLTQQAVGNEPVAIQVSEQLLEFMPLFLPPTHE